MTSITATSYDTGTSSTTVAATAATRQIASVSSQDTAGNAVQGDTFGPAVVVEISDEAKEMEAIKPYDLEKDITYLKDKYNIWAKDRGISEGEQKIYVEKLDINLREGNARMLESKAWYERITKLEATQQGNMEGALDQAEGAPQSLIDAVRTVNSFRNDAGGIGSSVGYDAPEFVQQFTKLHGEEAMQRLTAMAKAYDAASGLRAQSSAAALGRYGLEGSAFTTDNGRLKVNAFTLGKIEGGYSLSFDPETSAFTVMRQGEDITAAIFKGTAFRQDSARSA